MEEVTSKVLLNFFQRLGEQVKSPVILYLLGGSALCLLGSSRETLDVDYFSEEITPEVEATLKSLAKELQIDLEHVPLKEFIPLPPDAKERRHLIGRYGQVEVYIYDLYSIALSKIARGFESDFEDTEFMLRQKLIDWDDLKKYFRSILPRAKDMDIDPLEFQQYFETLSHRLG